MNLAGSVILANADGSRTSVPLQSFIRLIAAEIVAEVGAALEAEGFVSTAALAARERRRRDLARLAGSGRFQIVAKGGPQ